LLHLDTGEEFPVTGLPESMKIRNVRWSPSGAYLAFLNSTERGQDLWVVEVAAKSAKKLVDGKVNSVYGSSFIWLPDNMTLVCKIISQERGEAPVEASVPAGPVIQETSGKKAAARTYQDLLENAHDEMLFEYHTTVQLLKITLDGTETSIGSSGIIRKFEPSPNGQFLLVETVHRPFSYLVPVRRFPYRVEVWDLEGNLVKEIAERPLAEDVPIAYGGVPKGPRSFEWRSDTPAMLSWVEAQDEGDPKIEAEIRDILYSLDAPFTGDPVPLLSFELRYSTILWGNETLALAYEWWWDQRRVRSWKLNPSQPEAEPTVVFDYSWQDRYNDPGNPVMRPLPNGHYALLTDQKAETLYLIGDGASPEGDRPFIDAFDLGTKETTRLFRSEAPYYEDPVRLLDVDQLRLLTRRESVSEPPNFFIRDLKADTLAQVTHFPHPTPQLKDVQKEMIRYEREDGVKMTATLYLPPDYTVEDGPLPMLMWAYPQEFKDADAAGQVTDSPYRFVRVGWWSPLLWLVMGYAVLDDPTLPIVGEGEEEPNDTYVEQLISGAQAAVDEVVRRGVAEPGRIAIGGHSYGAFMTANLLAHTDLFVAGIARSGAYNRTLTPFGFQAEERTLWEASDVYFSMSPFMHADKIHEPILLIHGEADNNSGTFPMQSERFYNALKGHGGTARLVMLPHESHSYRARESIMHMLWETTNWLEEYVKNANTDKEE
jgi:dipeptidyl aminopeptidase/acylaminoacyl peptidase